MSYDLTKLDELYAKATKGEWKREYMDWCGRAVAYKPHIRGDEHTSDDGTPVATAVCVVEGNATSIAVTEATADLIIALHNAYPALRRDLDAALSREAGLREALRFYVGAGDTRALVAMTASPASTLVADLRKERDEARAEVERLKAQVAMAGEVKLTGHQHWGMQLMDGLGKFCEQAATADGPLTTTIEVRFPDSPHLPVLYLWATTSEQEPVARCHELASSRDAMKGAIAERDAELTALRSRVAELEAAAAKLLEAIGYADSDAFGEASGTAAQLITEAKAALAAKGESNAK